MSGSPVSSINIVIEAQPVSERPLSLSPGEVVKGVVQEVRADGTLVLMLKGKLVEASSEIPVSKGQTIQLLVDNIKDGKIFLKALGVEFITQLDTAKLSANLKNMGINPGLYELQLADKLLQHQLPVTQANMNTLHKGTAMLGEINSRNMDITAFAMSRGLAVNKETVTMLAQYFSKTDLGEVFQKLTQVLASLMPEAGKTAAVGTVPIPVQVTGEMEDGIQLAAARNTSSAETAPRPSGMSPMVESKPNSDIMANRLTSQAQEILKTLGGLDSGKHTGPVPGNVSNNAANPVTNSANPNITATGNSNIDGTPLASAGQAAGSASRVNATAAGHTAESSTVNPGLNNGTVRAESNLNMPPSGNQAGLTTMPEQKIIELLQSLIENLKVKPEQNTALLSEQLKNAVQERHEQIQNLTMIQRTLEQVVEGSKSPVFKELITLINDLTRELASQQLMNVTNRFIPAENTNFYYFALPVQIGPDQQQVQIRINKEQKERSWQDAEQMSLAVSLDTKHLGLVLFYVNWNKQGEVLMQGVVQTEAVRDYINVRLPSLIQGLQGLGLQVTNQGIRVAKLQDTDANLRLTVDDLAAPVKPWVVDIKI